MARIKRNTIERRLYPASIPRADRAPHNRQGKPHVEGEHKESKRKKDADYLDQEFAYSPFKRTDHPFRRL